MLSARVLAEEHVAPVEQVVDVGHHHGAAVGTGPHGRDRVRVERIVQVPADRRRESADHEVVLPRQAAEDPGGLLCARQGSLHGDPNRRVADGRHGARRGPHEPSRSWASFGSSPRRTTASSSRTARSCSNTGASTRRPVQPLGEIRARARSVQNGCRARRVRLRAGVDQRVDVDRAERQEPPPVPAVRRVEDVLVPLLRLAEPLGVVQCLRDQQRRVEERLPVVDAVGAVEVQVRADRQVRLVDPVPPAPG